jgi:hypothetical protein
MVNLEISCSPAENNVFISLFREYKYIFTWTYDNLKTFDTNIIQHVIPMKPDTKPFQQKLRKMHPNMEPLVKGDIKLCVDFRNLNRASKKDNYLVPPMEQIFQCVS